MKSNSLITYPPSGGSSRQPGDAHSSRYSYFPHETVMETFYGLPGPEFDKPFIRRPTSDFRRTEGNDIVCPTLYRQEPNMEWHQMHTIAYQYPKLENSYELSPSNGERIQNDLFSRDPNENFVYEYTWPQSDGSGISGPSSVEPGFASEYLLNSIQQNCANKTNDLNGLDNAIMESPADLQLLSISHSLKMGNQTSSDSPLAFNGTPVLFDTLSSKASDDGEGDSGDANILAAEGLISDAPYAKLIYKALMEAPNHSMVLQDIYQWFIDNTEKGNSASTGWRNSIRHNLSMNAAFRKTSRKSNGDDTKKTSEWVLEPFAITEGVTPTTRYRKNGKKTYKSRNSAPTRVRSGKSASVPARKSKFQSQQSPGWRQDMIYDQKHRTPAQHCTPPVMDQCNQSPYTPDYHQPLTGSHYHSSSSFLDGLVQFADIKQVQMDDEGMICMDGYEHYGDRYPYVWTNSHYY